MSQNGSVAASNFSPLSALAKGQTATAARGSMPVLDPRLPSLSAVLDLVRSSAASTRPEIEALTGLSRKVVAQRVSELLDAGVLNEGPLGPSTGGRAPRRLAFSSSAGVILVAAFGSSGMSAGLANLSGTMITQEHRTHPIADGPEAGLALAVKLWKKLLRAAAADDPGIERRVWGAGISLPGPVEFLTARPVAPPIMPGWDNYPVRERIQHEWAVPVWVDNDVNAMALGELRTGVARGSSEVIYVKLGTGIGAGIVSRGGLHRGARGVAGDVGHIAVREKLGVRCRCGRIDCLEAVAGGAALLDQARQAAANGSSETLQRLMKRDGALTLRHLTEAAEHGDTITIDLLRDSGLRVGEMLASLINTLNPSLIVLGGHVAESGDLVLATVRQAIYDRSHPVATRDLVITRSVDSDAVGLTGAAFIVIDEVFATEALGRWIDNGRPSSALQSA